MSFENHYFGVKFTVMSRSILVLFAALFSLYSFGQSHENIADAKAGEEFKNIHVRKMDSDPLASTFLIWVKNSVKEHYHAEHTEVVQVIEGEGVLTLGDDRFDIKAGDYIFIPKGTHHSVEVTSGSILKALSIQTPFFDGKDRIFVSKE